MAETDWSYCTQPNISLFISFSCLKMTMRTIPKHNITGEREGLAKERDKTTFLELRYKRREFTYENYNYIEDDAEVFYCSARVRAFEED